MGGGNTKGYKGEVDVGAIKNVLEMQNIKFRKRNKNNIDINELTRQKEEMDRKAYLEEQLKKGKTIVPKVEKLQTELEKKMESVMMNKIGFDRLIEKELLAEKEAIINKVNNEEISSLARMRTMFADLKDANSSSNYNSREK